MELCGYKVLSIKLVRTGLYEQLKQVAWFTKIISMDQGISMFNSMVVD